MSVRFIVTGIALLALSVTARAQFPETPEPVKLYPLQNTSHREIAQILQETLNVRVSLDDRLNAIVVKASDEQHAEIVELLGLLDVATPGDQKLSELIYPAQHRSSDSLAKTLQQSFRGRPLNVSSDSPSATVILHGSAELVAEARRLLGTIDKPAVEERTEYRSWHVTVDFVRGRFGATDPGSLPPHLAGVAKALAQDGVGDLHAMGHLMTHCDDGVEFSVNGMIQLDGVPQPILMRFTATVDELEHGVRLAIDSALEVPTQSYQADTVNWRYTTFGIETAVTVTVGDHLALGAIPTAIGESDTIVMVLRVRSGS